MQKLPLSPGRMPLPRRKAILPLPELPSRTEGVPFAYAVLQPAKDAFAPKVVEENSRDRDEQDSMQDEDDAGGEKRRAARRI